MMRKSLKFSPQVCERAVRLVAEHQAAYESQWATIVSIASKIGATPQMLLNWMHQHERDSGQ
jgi:transposase